MPHTQKSQTGPLLGATGPFDASQKGFLEPVEPFDGNF
jgi:hypothetical protein